MIFSLVRVTLLFVFVLTTLTPVFAQQDRFSATGLGDSEILNFFNKLQAVVRSNDVQAVLRMIQFPLVVNQTNGPLLINNSKQFAAVYGQVFDRSLKSEILHQSYAELFGNWQGVMIGNGAVWFTGICAPSSQPGECRDSRIRITTINRTALKSVVSQPAKYMLESGKSFVVPTGVLWRISRLEPYRSERGFGTADLYINGQVLVGGDKDYTISGEFDISINNAQQFPIWVLSGTTIEVGDSRGKLAIEQVASN